ncbi:HNH endonuclease [Achromobacter xylosoxidans]|nr:HNH endonuclease [Achromobacter xylosoxidans]
MAQGAGRDRADIAAFINALAAETGRPIRQDRRYQWPRVGIADQSQVIAVLHGLHQLFDGSLAPASEESAASARYWWVSHNQMHQNELDGGYIWCPQTTTDGGKRETWTNVSRVRKGDMIFSYAKTKIQAIGVATANAEEASAPEGYHSWNDSGWRVNVKWEKLESPISPKEHWATIGALFPAIHSPLRADGSGNLTYLAALSVPLGLRLLELAGTENDDAVANVDRDILEQSEAGPTEVERIYQARIGQGTYRKNVIAVESQCRVTGMANVELLIASHIKPWRQSSNQERLDGNNGLLLSPHVDKLFDAGWISFSDQGDLLVGNDGVRNALLVWGINPDSNVGQFNEDQKRYLAYHRETIFLVQNTSPGE